MSWQLVALDAILIAVVVALGGAVLRLRGYRLTELRPTVDRDRIRTWWEAVRRPAAHGHGSERPGSRYADLEVRPPLFGHPTQHLTAEQVQAALAEGRDGQEATR